VANYGNDTIEKFNSSGVGSTFAAYSTNGVGQYLQAPIGLAFDSSGNLYVANHFTASILEYNSSGTGTLFASGLGNAINLAIEVPEPSSLLLAALGALSLVAFLRRKRM
jgi:DNA-binding beta-propeller fold protein YncE